MARIGKNLIADQVKDILASSVGKDVRLTKINGKVEVTAGDDIQIHVDLPQIPEIRAKAGSNVSLYLARPANCQLIMVSGGYDIELHAGDQQAVTKEREFSVPLGEGGEKVFLTAGDRISVSDQGTPDWENDDDIWEKDYWEKFGNQLAQSVKNGLQAAGNSVEQALQKAGLASRQAGMRVERVFHDLDDRGFNFKHSGRVIGFSRNEGIKSSINEKSGPTDGERMLVLKMLQEKKITVEEAEKLLNALER